MSLSQPTSYLVLSGRSIPSSRPCAVPMTRRKQRVFARYSHSCVVYAAGHPRAEFANFLRAASRARLNRLERPLRLFPGSGSGSHRRCVGDTLRT